MDDNFAKLRAILPQGELSARTQGTSVSIEYAAMYESPEISFANLKAVADLFGTLGIVVDGHSEPGCETCDYGSRYWHDIRVTGATSGLPCDGKDGKR